MAAERARALVTFLGMAFGRLVITFNKFSRWEPKDRITRGAIGDRQALKMLYDFSDINPFGAYDGQSALRAGAGSVLHSRARRGRIPVGRHARQRREAVLRRRDLRRGHHRPAVLQQHLLRRSLGLLLCLAEAPRRRPLPRALHAARAAEAPGGGGSAERTRRRRGEGEGALPGPDAPFVRRSAAGAQAGRAARVRVRPPHDGRLGDADPRAGRRRPHRHRGVAGADRVAGSRQRPRRGRPLGQHFLRRPAAGGRGHGTLRKRTSNPSCTPSRGNG